MLRSATIIAITALASVSSVIADGSLIKCSATSKCPDSIPCCGFYGYCSLPGSLECYTGCDPVNSFKPKSCFPNPVCKDTTVNFSDVSRIWSKPNTWAGDVENYDLILEEGEMTKTAQGTILLKLTKDGGTRLSTSRYMMYGTWTFVAKAPNAIGICSAGVTMSDVRDEVDVEFPGNMPLHVSPNWFYRGSGAVQAAIGAEISNMNAGNDRSRDFHTYSVSWTPDAMIWSRDGVVIRTDKKSNTLVDGSYRYPSTPSRLLFSIMDMSQYPFFTGGAMDWSKNPTYYMELKSMSLKCAADPKVVSGITGYQYTSDSTTRGNAKIEYTNRPLHPYFTGECVSTFKRVDELLCWQIAAANGLSSDDIVALNPDVNCAAMPDDQVLCLSRNGIVNPSASIPPANASAPAASVGVSTTAAPSASVSVIAQPVSIGNCTKNITRTNEALCWQIAAANNISTAQIIALNPTVNCTAMPNDQVLCLERAGAVASTMLVSLSSTTSSQPSGVSGKSGASASALSSAPSQSTGAIASNMPSIVPSSAPTSSANIASIKSVASVIAEHSAAISAALTSANGYVGGLTPDSGNTAAAAASSSTSDSAVKPNSSVNPDAASSSALQPDDNLGSSSMPSAAIKTLTMPNGGVTTVTQATPLAIKTMTIPNGAVTTSTQDAPAYVASSSTRNALTNGGWATALCLGGLLIVNFR